MSVPEIRKKLVVVGDGACGKTCLLLRFAHNNFNETHVPTIFETTVTDVVTNGVSVELSLWDTAGQEEYDMLRPFSYKDAEVVLIVFSVDSTDSLFHVTAKWIGEVQHYCKGVPIVLVGCKADLRNDPAVLERLGRVGEQPVSTQQGEDLARRIGARKYIECSAKTGAGVHHVFEFAASCAIAPIVQNNYKPVVKKKKCTIL